MTDRTKLSAALRVFAAFANPNPAQAMSDAAAQIEADGVRETALLDISARFAEVTARAIKAEAENGRLRDQIEQGQAGRVAMTERAWQQDRRVEALEAENARLREALKPFAAFAVAVAENHPGWDHDAFYWQQMLDLGTDLRLGAFRRARAVLDGKEYPGALG